MHIFQPADPHLAAFCELLCVSADELARWLCHRRIVLVAETVVKPVPKEKAVNAKDALAKQIYAHLFDRVISSINTALRVPAKQHAFIGVLDIYGYVVFLLLMFLVPVRCCFRPGCLVSSSALKHLTSTASSNSV